MFSWNCQSCICVQAILTARQPGFANRGSATHLHILHMHIRHCISCTILASSALSKICSLHVSSHMHAITLACLPCVAECQKVHVADGKAKPSNSTQIKIYPPMGPVTARQALCTAYNVELYLQDTPSCSCKRGVCTNLASDHVSCVTG